MTTARARHYPQPPSAEIVMGGDRCDHGELDGRCALCRLAAKPDDGPDAPAHATQRPAPRRAADDVGEDETWPAADRSAAITSRPAVADDDDRDPRSVDWWQR